MVDTDEKTQAIINQRAQELAKLYPRILGAATRKSLYFFLAILLLLINIFSRVIWLKILIFILLFYCFFIVLRLSVQIRKASKWINYFSSFKPVINSPFSTKPFINKGIVYVTKLSYGLALLVGSAPLLVYYKHPALAFTFMAISFLLLFFIAGIAADEHIKQYIDMWVKPSEEKK